MMPFQKTQILQTINRWLRLWLCCCAAGCVFGTGCQQRAYTELYVENMASEIRMLEDRIYEYDAAYMEKDAGYESLVHEVERLKKINADLQRRYETQQLPESSSRKMESPPLRLKGKPEPRESIEMKPKAPSGLPPDSSLELPSVLIPNSTKPESIENPPVVSRTPTSPPPIKNIAPDAGEFLPPGGDAVLPAPLLPEKSKGQMNDPQSSNGSKRNLTLPSVLDLNERVSRPESTVRSAQQANPSIFPSQPPNLPASNPRSSESSQPNSQPNNVPSLLQRAFPKIKEGNTQGAIQRGMIRLPEGSKVQFASANEPLASSKPTEIVDNKIVEIAFHPTMCRGHNFDERPGDDGLYLVVTPINATGQILNQTGDLTIIVEDAAVTKDNGRIAAWEFTAEQLAETLEPIGTAQGFHLSLPWQDKVPTSKVVNVYLRYSSANGRTHVNQREVHLRIPTAEQPVWTPRKTTAPK